MKKLLTAFALLTALVGIHVFTTHAQSVPTISPFGYNTSSSISTYTSYPVTVTNLANGSLDCVGANASGTLVLASGPCGSGGGSSTISINGVSSTVFSLNSSTYIGITASGTAFTFTNLGVTTFNGSSGAITGVNSVNGATGTVSIATGTFSQWTTTSTGIFYNGGSVGIGNTDNLANFSGSSTIAWDYNDYLNAASNLAFTATSTQIQISNVTGLAPSGLVQLNGTEIAYYSSFTSAGASSTLNGMTRHLFGTAAVSATGTVNAITNITANDSSHLPTYAVECLSATSCNYAWNSAGLGNSGSQFVFQGQTYNQGAFLATNFRSVSGNYFTNSTAVPLTLQIGTAATSSEFTIASGTAYVGIGTTTPATELEVYGTSSFMGGNVGIGTTTPSAGLDIVGGSAVVDYTQFFGSRNSINNIVPLLALGSGSMSGHTQSNLYRAGYSNVNGFEIGTVGAAGIYGIQNDGTTQNQFGIYTAGTQRLTVASSGYVGIGTTAPSSTLTVANGDVLISSSTRGIIMHDTTNYANCYRLQVTSGLVVPTSIVCP